MLDPTAKTDWTVIAGQSTIAGMASSAASSLETTVYTSSSTHDAFGRVLTAISPDGSEVAYSYNERGALKTVNCKHRGSITVTPVVADITYDVRGRRESISYASNATTTTYDYDPLNFRLRSIETTRASDSKKLQGLHYHYDPVGNVTDIRDDAQQTVYFQNSIVDAANSYVYDALYRLVEATGREHATQGTAQRSSSQLLPDSSAVPMNNDPNALRRYTQSYTYDAVGNIATMVHARWAGPGGRGGTSTAKAATGSWHKRTWRQRESRLTVPLWVEGRFRQCRLRSTRMSMQSSLLMSPGAKFSFYPCQLG